jgi:predicted HNH restriction endonuclease
VDVRFDRILDPDADDPLPLSKLETGRLATVNWSTQVSGIDIGEAADELEEVWRQHLRLYAEDEAGQSALEGEVRVALRRHRARERWLREAKIAEWKAAHDGRLPCHVCGFEFREAYGEIGRDYAQVHHLKPLGDRLRPSETRLGDLAVLCANCHVMVHRGGESRPIDRLGG